VNLLPADMLLPLLPVFALLAALVGWALVDITRRPVQHLPKPMWALIVLLLVPGGAILYLVMGRSRGPRLRDADLR